MMGKPVGVLRAFSTLPMQKSRTRMKMNARPPLMAMVWTRIFGMTVEALRTSSLMWMAPSKPAGTVNNHETLVHHVRDEPMKQYVTVNMPRHQEIPSLFQPPSFRSSVNTNSGVLRGASRTRGTASAMKNVTCIMPPKSWIRGRIWMA